MHSCTPPAPSGPVGPRCSCRAKLLAFAAKVLLAGCLTLTAHASTVVVPDDLPTIQQGIDSGADTVLIREGTYPERSVVDRPIVLSGIGHGARPQLGGLDIFNTNFRTATPMLTASRIDFTATVNHKLSSAFPRNLELRFSDCHLDGGFYQALSMDPDDINVLAFQDCFLAAGNRARAAQVIMERDTVSGLAAWRTHEVSVTHCVFGGAGLQLTDSPRGIVAFNRMALCDVGLNVQDADLTIEANDISGCTTGMHLSGSRADLIRNSVTQCGVGISVESIIDLNLIGNTVIGMQGRGLDCWEVTYLWADSNVVGHCGGIGMAYDWPYSYDSATIQRNTVFANGGSGIALTGQTIHRAVVENNIVSGSGGWGLTIGPGVGVDIGCNDWFGNALGAVSGVAAGPTDLNVDPLFCNVDSADVRLDSSSPLVGAAGCGQIGALGVGCGETPTLVQRFTAGRGSDGVRVIWEVAAGATASEIWLERSEVSSEGPWTRPVTERTFDNRAMVELDRSAVSERPYWYRLVALEGRDAVVIGAPILVEAQARPEFRLTEVGPSPGRGPIRIAFSLEHAGAIEVTVLDVQGRTVARIAGGELAAGPHAIAWNGEGARGRVPPGLYLIRYRFPGGQDSRRIVISR
jgi:hypothetical protein